MSSINITIESMTFESLRNRFLESLKGLYSERESESIFYILLEDFFELDRVKFSLNKHEIPEESNCIKLISAIKELKTGKPVQYVTGLAHFLGLKFHVNSHVLIPRQETELLVREIDQKNKEIEMHCLEIGSGSGCIPISLNFLNPNWKIDSWDVSKEAIKIAEFNNATHKQSVNFHHKSCLESNEWKHQGPFDLMVSNPPYVCLSEKNHMHVNVKDHEPELALFVNDNNPLIFYDRICTFGLPCLKPQGQLWFEVNEKLAKAVGDLMKLKGFINIRILLDLNGKDRIVYGNKG